MEFGLFAELSFMALSPKMSSSMAADCKAKAEADGTSESSPSPT